jgi:hypothetical protein
MSAKYETASSSDEKMELVVEECFTERLSPYEGPREMLL